MNDALEVVSVAALEREVRELERVADLVRRRDVLRAELTALGVEWNTLPLPAEDIVKIVAARHGLTYADLVGPDRDADITRARHEAMHVLFAQVKSDGSKRFSKAHIGRILGGRDHTTVMNGLARHAERQVAP